MDNISKTPSSTQQTQLVDIEQAASHAGAEQSTIRRQLSQASNDTSALSPATTLHDFDKLPNEIKIKVVKNLIFADVERFSLTNKKHNMLVKELYNPPSKIEFAEELKKAIKEGNNNAVERLVKVGGAEAINVSDNDMKNTALHWACKFAKADIVKRLIQLGANVNVVDDFGRTPLAFAVANYRDQSIIKSLLDKGANPNIICCPSFFSVDANSTLLMLAADSNRVDVLPLLKEASVSNVCAVDNGGRTVLHRAVFRNVPSTGAPDPSPEVLQKLFELFPKDLKTIIKQSDKNGRTVLHHAAIHANNQTLLTLLRLFPVELKEIINQSDNDGKTALMLARTGDEWNGDYHKDPDPNNALSLTAFSIM